MLSAFYGAGELNPNEPYNNIVILSKQDYFTIENVMEIMNKNARI